jgi:hypothetical protein
MKSKFLSFIIVVIFAVSCQSKEEKEEKLIIYQSEWLFEKSVDNIKKSGYTVNVDSFKTVFEKHKSENLQAALDFAKRFEEYSIKLLQKRGEIELEKQQAEIKKQEEDRKVWENSKYGRLQKKYPSWSDEDCKLVLDNKIWIGMSFEMLKYQRGKPNSANPSNYGNGTSYQWCWNDYTPRCFYGGEDGIITAYN